MHCRILEAFWSNTQNASRRSNTNREIEYDNNVTGKDKFQKEEEIKIHIENEDNLFKYKITQKQLQQRHIMKQVQHNSNIKHVQPNNSNPHKILEEKIEVSDAHKDNMCENESKRNEDT